MPNEPSGSFVRWQAITIGQLTYAVNLVLTFSVATLGFQLSLLQNSSFAVSAWGKCVFVISLICIMLSSVFGIWVVINRLRDFRVTMKAARKRELMQQNSKSKEEIDSELGPYRALSNRLGKTTWTLFWWQIGTFSVGLGFVAISVLANFGQKLL